MTSQVVSGGAILCRQEPFILQLTVSMIGLLASAPARIESSEIVGGEFQAPRDVADCGDSHSGVSHSNGNRAKVSVPATS